MVVYAPGRDPIAFFADLARTYGDIAHVRTAGERLFLFNHPRLVKDVLVTIRELAEDGMTCMIVTHEMGFAREVADQVYFTDGGILVEHGAPKQFFANPRDPRTRQFLDQIL